MALYHLWHPAFVDGARLELFVTLGDALHIARDVERLARAALESLGVGAAPERAEMEATRTHYFGSYRGATGDWHDDWALAWRLRVDLPSRIALPEPPPHGFFDLDEAGSGPDLDDADEWPAWRCLVLADAPDDEVLERARALSARFREASLTVGEAFAAVPQLRCDLGPRPRDFFERGAPEAESLLAALVET